MYRFNVLILFFLLVVLQVLVAFIPGEPVELVAGYTFGILEGTLLTMAGCNYFMGIPHGDDIMLNYQTTGFRETAALRQITGKTAIPEFQRWLEKMGFVENGKLTKKAGDGSSLLF